jgi:hypothetical protein
MAGGDNHHEGVTLIGRLGTAVTRHNEEKNWRLDGTVPNRQRD